MLHQITLHRAKGDKNPVLLTYVEEPLRSSQARFTSRTTLTPQIELDAYRCRAVIDWIDIHFELSRPTQHWHINERIKKLTGRKEYAEALNTGAGMTASQYRLRVQEPDLSSVRTVLEDLQKNYSLASPATICAIEISIDFYPKSPSDEARAKMHGVLVRHFFPTTRVLTNSRTWPRFMPGSLKSTDYVVSRNEGDASLDIGDRMTPGMDRQALYDSTYYVGERDSSRAFWRIQNKVLDKQNKAAGTRDKLPDDMKRTRIEVTLGEAGCREVGLDSLDDLGAAKITRLQKSFFQFMKPTFLDVRPNIHRAGPVAVKRKVEEYRKQRFFNAGVLGLQIRDGAREELRAIEMPNIRKMHRRSGTKMPTKTRAGAGAFGTMVAYGELTRMVERALAGLEYRVRGEMGTKKNS